MWYNSLRDFISARLILLVLKHSSRWTWVSNTGRRDERWRRVIGWKGTKGCIELESILSLKTKLELPKQNFLQLSWGHMASFWPFGLAFGLTLQIMKLKYLSCWKKTCCFMITWQREYLRMYEERSLQSNVAYCSDYKFNVFLQNYLYF